MKAFIFDFDGVIMDTQRHWNERGLEVYQQFVPHWTEVEHLKLKGNNEHQIYDMLVKEHGAMMTKEEYTAHIEAFAAIVYGELADPFPGVPELLDRLISLGIPAAIASSAHRLWIEEALQRNGLLEKFASIVSLEDVPGHWKPEPDCYLLAAKRLGFDPTECVGVEDTNTGLRAIKAADMYAIVFRSGSNMDQDLSLADKEISHFDQLDLKVLHELFHR